MIKGDLGVAWRTVFTATSFFLFGLGALCLGFVILPLIHVTHRASGRAQLFSRRTIRWSLRLFIGFMNRSGVLDYTISGTPQVEPGTLVVANHPSLIDVIFILAALPDALCVVKEELGRNFFTRAVVGTIGYPTNVEPRALIDECVRLLNERHTIVMFPEGTRTPPGSAPTFKRGAATVICRALCPVTPIFLRISPPTLSKGESWLKAPPTKVHFFMEIGEPISAGALFDPQESERMSARVCTNRLQELYWARLSNPANDRAGADRGKPADRHQGSDREDP